MQSWEGYVLKRIEELCEKEGWSHYVLAKRSGISQSTISNMFSRTNQPTFITVAKVCDAFGITMAQFFDSEQHLDLTDEQEDILRMYDVMSAQKKELVKAFMNGLMKS